MMPPSPDLDAMSTLEAVVHSGDAFVARDLGAGALGGLTAAVPLQLEGCVTGVVAIFHDKSIARHNPGAMPGSPPHHPWLT